MDTSIQTHATILSLGLSSCHVQLIMNWWERVDNDNYRVFNKKSRKRDGEYSNPSQQYRETGIPIARTNKDFIDYIVNYVARNGMGVNIAPVREQVLRERFWGLVYAKWTASLMVPDPEPTSLEPFPDGRGFASLSATSSSFGTGPQLAASEQTSGSIDRGLVSVSTPCSSIHGKSGD